MQRARCIVNAPGGLWLLLLLHLWLLLLPFVAVDSWSCFLLPVSCCGSWRVATILTPCPFLPLLLLLLLRLWLLLLPVVAVDVAAAVAFVVAVAAYIGKTDRKSVLPM